MRVKFLSYDEKHKYSTWPVIMEISVFDIDDETNKIYLTNLQGECYVSDKDFSRINVHLDDIYASLLENGCANLQYLGNFIPLEEVEENEMDKETE